jgi:hypothetical protein
MLVATVRQFEHAHEYPEAWIEQMKRIGIYGPPAHPLSRRCNVAGAPLRDWPMVSITFRAPRFLANSRRCKR